MAGDEGKLGFFFIFRREEEKNFPRLEKRRGSDEIREWGTLSTNNPPVDSLSVCLVVVP